MAQECSLEADRAQRHMRCDALLVGRWIRSTAAGACCGRAASPVGETTFQRFGSTSKTRPLTPIFRPLRFATTSSISELGSFRLSPSTSSLSLPSSSTSSGSAAASFVGEAGPLGPPGTIDLRNSSRLAISLSSMPATQIVDLTPTRSWYDSASKASSAACTHPVTVCPWP